MSLNKSLYFPGLNGIRAFAAMAVVISHINNRLELFDVSGLPLMNMADFAVSVFFSLSGFLITYLLLLELKNTGSINIKSFYVRRILRIWPLYYLYLFLSALVMGFDTLTWVFLLYIFILPNFRNSLAQFFNGAVSSLSFGNYLVGHYWSLGVEEQFYAFWPWFIRRNKKILQFLIVFPFVFILLKVVLNLLNAPYSILVFVNYSRFGCMAIGALGAYLYFYHKDLILRLNNRYLEIATYIFFILIIFNKFKISSAIDHEIASFFTLVLIISQISNPEKLISFENPIFNFLGKISFGLYVWNPLVIYLCSFVLIDFLSIFNFSNTINLIIVFVFNIFFIILVSYLSYEYFEKRFLKIKKKFMIVKSSNAAHEK